MNGDKAKTCSLGIVAVLSVKEMLLNFRKYFCRESHVIES